MLRAAILHGTVSSLFFETVAHIIAKLIPIENTTRKGKKTKINKGGQGSSGYKLKTTMFVVDRACSQ